MWPLPDRKLMRISSYLVNLETVKTTLSVTILQRLLQVNQKRNILGSIQGVSQVTDERLYSQSSLTLIESETEIVLLLMNEITPS